MQGQIRASRGRGIGCVCGAFPLSVCLPHVCALYWPSAKGGTFAKNLYGVWRCMRLEWCACAFPLDQIWQQIDTGKSSKPSGFDAVTR